MSATMSKTLMSPDFLTKFLPVLWQIRSADYSNRTKRDEAWDLLVQLTREKIPEADLCFVKKKVGSIRASFRKELRRVRDSKRSGLSADDVYKPTLVLRLAFVHGRPRYSSESNIVRFHLTFSSSFVVFRTIISNKIQYIQMCISVSI